MRENVNIPPPPSPSPSRLIPQTPPHAIAKLVSLRRHTPTNKPHISRQSNAGNAHTERSKFTICHNKKYVKSKSTAPPSHGGSAAYKKQDYNNNLGIPAQANPKPFYCLRAVTTDTIPSNVSWGCSGRRRTDGASGAADNGGGGSRQEGTTYLCQIGPGTTGCGVFDGPTTRCTSVHNRLVFEVVSQSKMKKRVLLYTVL